MPKNKIKFQNVLKMPQKRAKFQHHSLSWQNRVKFCKDFTRDRVFFTQTLFARSYVFASLAVPSSCWLLLLVLPSLFLISSLWDFSVHHLSLYLFSQPQYLLSGDCEHIGMFADYIIAGCTWPNIIKEAPILILLPLYRAQYCISSFYIPIKTNIHILCHASWLLHTVHNTILHSLHSKLYAKKTKN